MQYSSFSCCHVVPQEQCCGSIALWPLLLDHGTKSGFLFLVFSPFNVPMYPLKAISSFTIGNDPFSSRINAHRASQILSSRESYLKKIIIIIISLTRSSDIYPMNCLAVRRRQQTNKPACTHASEVVAN